MHFRNVANIAHIHTLEHNQPQYLTTLKTWTHNQ
jgi:hypothetical protein